MIPKSTPESTPDDKPDLPQKDTLDTIPLNDFGEHDTCQKSKLTISYREKLINLHGHARRRRSSALRHAKGDSAASQSENTVLSEDQPIELFQNIFAAPIEIDSEYVAPEYPKSGEEIIFLDCCMRNNFIFSGLSAEEKDMLIKAMEPAEAAKGDLIIKQGNIRDYFYVIHSGAVSFIENGNEVNCGGRGDSFGELALLHDSPRTASAQAETDCCLFRVDQKTFRSILANNRAKASQGDLRILRKVDFLSCVDDSVLSKMSEALTTITFCDGAVILRKGDKGDVFYIVKKGKVLVSDIGLGESTFKDHTLECGDYFGERALLTGEKRAANISSVGDSELFCVSEDEFERAMGKLDVLIRAAQAKNIVKSIPMIADAKLESFEMDQLVSGLETVTYHEGDVLSRAGDVIGENPKYPHGVYFITHDIPGGEISTADSSGRVNVLGLGDYFGARTIKAKQGEETDLDIVANKNTSCKMIRIESIELVLSSVDRLGTARPYKKKQDTSITMDTLEKHTIIGAGTFGQVWLVSDKRTSHTYALKIQCKRELITQKQAKGAVREKNLLAGMESQFVMKMFNAFQDNKNIFMVTSLVQGGELFSLLREDTDGVPESSAKFYTSCILEGLSYMHRRRIVYRDLKPENIMIDKDGYCVLIDLGFAKVVLDKTYTICGTPLYIAPEILLSRGYDKSVDYWSLGAIIYEMLLGVSPFYSKGMDRTTLFKRILQVSYSFPDWCGASEAVQDLISHILVRNPMDRLGSRAVGAADIRDHFWLRDIVTADLHAKKIKAPWDPNIESALDISSFDDWDHLEDKQHICAAELTTKEQSLFENF